MPDIATIGALISSVKTATEIAKIIKDSDVSLQGAEAKLKVAELISTLADAKLELAEVQDLIREKDQEISSLKSKLEQKEAITYDGKFYWMKGDSVPFCAVCYERDGRYSHLTYNQASDYYEAYHKCKVCSAAYS
jgi:D-serine dehydratase